MQTVYAQMGISLDGFIAGPGDGPGNPLGTGGERIHEWVFDLAAWRRRQGLEGGRTGADNDRVVRILERNGAVVMGRRMFDNGKEPWGPNPPYRCPAFVVTHSGHEPLVREGGTTFHFATGGLQDALERARSAAGNKDVEISGGADLVQQCLLEGLLDELEIHIAPVLLGGGIRLFDRPELAGVRLERTEVAASADVTHVVFGVTAGDPS
jgi:dihydrofolate reductase